MKFIYVFSKEDRDVLLSKGYVLVKENKRRHQYIFSAKSVVDYSLDGIKYCFSNTLTF